MQVLTNLIPSATPRLAYISAGWRLSCCLDCSPAFPFFLKNLATLIYGLTDWKHIPCIVLLQRCLIYQLFGRFTDSWAKFWIFKGILKNFPIFDSLYWDSHGNKILHRNISGLTFDTLETYSVHCCLLQCCLLYIFFARSTHTWATCWFVFSYNFLLHGISIDNVLNTRPRLQNARKTSIFLPQCKSNRSRIKDKQSRNFIKHPFAGWRSVNSY